MKRLWVTAMCAKSPLSMSNEGPAATGTTKSEALGGPGGAGKDAPGEAGDKEATAPDGDDWSSTQTSEPGVSTR